MTPKDMAQQLVTHLETALTPTFENDDDWWDWQPSNIFEFYDGITRALELVDKPGRFLDVGSGLGNKLFIADRLGFDATGIERYKPYVDASRKLYPNLPVIHGNAETYNDYDEYQLVHCNGLAHNLDHQAHINQQIINRMTPGAYYWYSNVPVPDGDPVAHQIWQAR